MWSKILLSTFTLLVAFTILFASILRTASVRYEFNISFSESPNGNVNSNEKVDYFLAYPGKVLPDSPFWPLKALRDKIWFLFIT